MLSSPNPFSLISPSFSILANHSTPPPKLWRDLRNHVVYLHLVSHKPNSVLLATTMKKMTFEAAVSLHLCHCCHDHHELLPLSSFATFKLNRGFCDVNMPNPTPLHPRSISTSFSMILLPLPLPPRFTPPLPSQLIHQEENENEENKDEDLGL
ncbi:hypothetical protein PanWU01x14_026860 [Parasponia andersonii]|uniref:Uncharacterized protein n=1 Tax=Parasponia andersonii TaxID=3476 RepID=A0A2P5DW79_PARAD|nr:hypothetical protein PanWU01x14_026860 [Parasponia andersonii]